MSTKYYKESTLKRFAKGEGLELTAENAGQLKEILDFLPDDFAIQQGFSKSVSVCVYNVNKEDPHICFDDGES